MVRAIYLTLAALLALACVASAAPAPVAESDFDTSLEYSGSRQADEEEEQAHNSSADSSEEHDDDEDVEDDDDDDDEDSLIRRRRDVATTQETPSEAATETPSELEKDPEAVTTAVPVAPSRKPVLVLIRDALKKVTTDLPTAQVANNALQYFQQFEHFIQQTIEQVIGDDYDDDDETPATVVPNTDEIKQPEAESAQQQQPEKEVETAAPEPEPVKALGGASDSPQQCCLDVAFNSSSTHISQLFIVIYLLLDH
ncbi:FK506-binding protein 4 isoform X2 [Drosophila obscura]|uniref:FK506-binding protein 4 isoform X2 n=1 Tax=Drosophila obscura TaxID=7282 RepID=UPI001BB1F285|nr:FK506-binding protein 4 isoform X2 [Drosophila obscura]